MIFMFLILVKSVYICDFKKLSANYMPRLRIHILFIVVLLCGCGAGGRRAATDGLADGADTVYESRYAERFTLLSRGDTLILRVRDPWQGARGLTFDYRFTEPLKRVVCMSSSHVAFLDAAGGAGVIKGVSGKRFLTTGNVDGAVDVGYDNNINYEQLVALRPDAVLMYEVGGENSATVAKMEQMGLRVIYIADYLESSPLARAEWVVALGALIGRQAEAEKVFSRVDDRYITLRSRVDSLLKTRGERRPKVMLNSPYKDVWYLPGDRSYMVQLLRDAGADYLGRGVDDDKSRPMSSEVAYDLMRGADFWLNPGMTTTMEGLREDNARFAKLEVVRRGDVYNNNARITKAGGSDFWESGILNADVVLADLVKIFHGELTPEHEFYYYRKLQ